MKSKCSPKVWGSLLSLFFNKAQFHRKLLAHGYRVIKSYCRMPERHKIVTPCELGNLASLILSAFCWHSCNDF